MNSSESSETEYRPMITIYLRDGTGYGALDYWLTNGVLHFETTYGSEKSFPIDQVDMQRTVNENAARGVYFTFYTSPSPSDPGPMLAQDSYAPPCPAESEPSGPAPPARISRSEESWFGATGIPGDRGLTVKSARAGSPATKVGIRPGDIVVRIDCQRVHSAEDIESAATNTTGTIWISYLIQGAWLTDKKFTVR